MKAVSLASLVALLAFTAASCGGSRTSFDDQDGGSGARASSGGLGSFGSGDVDGGGKTDEAGTTVTSTTIYANTDDSLYALDPATNAVSLIGKLTDSADSATDCAVNEAGEVFVNTATVIYKAALPAGGTGAVHLKKIADISTKPGQRFYALAFAPSGLLGPGETLVAGDADGELWSIDPANGATRDLGSFGADKSNVFALSGDIVFYRDGAGNPTGIATIRSCKPDGSSCTTNDDYLAGIDIAALTTAYTSGSRAASLLGGVYGGSASSKGTGIGHGELFGLGAWQGQVFGFERAKANGGKPALLTVDTQTGVGKTLPGTFSFTNGWSGACVTTKVTVTVPPPPSAPK